jgi:CBS domain-containing protein
MPPLPSSSSVGSIAIHTRFRVSAEGLVSREAIVRCPTGGWLPLEACRPCGHCDHVSTPGNPDDWILLCSLGEDLIPPSPRAANVWSLATETPVSRAMSPAFCLASDVPATAAAHVFAQQGVDVGVVVDAQGHQAGAVSRADLLRAWPSSATSGNALTVHDIMTPFVMTFADTTPIAEAVRLTTSGYLHHAPVVSRDQVVGVVSPMALLRWLYDQLDDTELRGGSPSSRAAAGGSASRFASSRLKRTADASGLRTQLQAPFSV